MEFLGVTRGVARFLRDRIVTGELAPGQRLNEVEMAEQLNVSRPPLREAFRMLESTCLVESKPNKGTFVTGVSEKNLREIHAARRMIEGFAIELLKEEGTYSLSGLELNLKESAEISAPPPDNAARMLEYWKILSGFHVELVKSSNAFHLMHFYKIISDNLARYQLMYLRIPGTAKESIEGHRLILSHLKAGEYRLAHEALEKHLAYTFQRLMGKMINGGGAGYLGDRISAVR